MKLNLFLCCVAVLASTMISSAQGNNNPSFTRGFAGNVEAGVLFKDGFAGEYVNVSSGYNILPGLFAGVGIGIKNYYCPLKLFDSKKKIRLNLRLGGPAFWLSLFLQQN